MRINEILIEGVAGPKQCWPGHRKVGTQPGTGKNKGKRVNDCEKIGEDTVEEGEKRMSRAAKGNEKYGKDGMKALAKAGREGASDKKLDAIRDKHDKYDSKVDEESKGLYYNVNKRKKAGTSRDASSPKAPTAQAWKDAAKTAKKESVAEGIDELARVLELSGLNLTPDEQFDIIEEMVESLALEHGVDAEQIWEDFESVDDTELLDESAAWKNKSGKNKNGGLNAKGVASYRRENPGSKLQTAVTTKPSKLKKGSKAAKRRKSFCARMGGVKGPMKKPNGKPTRKALALRKWNC